MTDTTCLTGHLLIAMPAMQDPNFTRTVTYICEHTEQGALGIVINRPLDMDLGTIFDQLSLGSADPALARQPVLQGGPVHQERGFVLHEPEENTDQEFDATLAVTDAIRVTTSQDILSAMARGHGPRRAVVALGYAGWGAGQLEKELAQNAWLSVPATPQIIFDTPFELRWHESTRLLGFDPSTLSHQAGHA
ncbi:MAG: YqgE/AlgH family protein [Gammaproteobacteria bacterium]|nr:YqgE/AlgH family protein [Gammaproteobacteria bacterium]MDH5275447.1 YqgE/AlgH family protein [Gammaproteobacteria bacterium]